MMKNNSEPMLSRYFHTIAIKRGIPVSGTFELTRRCNFDCKMCYVHTHDTSKDVELTTDEWLNIAEKAKNQGMLFLLLTGGEPLIRKDFTELYTSLSKMGFMISLNTNGSLIDEKMFELFKDYPPVRINVSLYGGNEKTYENLCGNKQFHNVYNNITELKKSGISVSVNSVFNKYNCTDIEDIFKMADELGVNVRSASYMYPTVRVNGRTGYNEARFSPEDAGKYNVLCKKLTYSPEVLKQRAQDLIKPDSTECDDDSVIGEKVRCRAGRSSFWLTFDGRMMPCGMMTTPSVSVKENGFENAWEEIKKSTAEIRLPSECTSCENKKNCNVCAAMCYAETGSFSERPDYICKMVNSIIDEFGKLR